MSGGSYPGMTPAEQAAYDQGYRDGESSASMDWSWALTEFTDLPDDVDQDSAHAVAAYMVPLVEFAQLVLNAGGPDGEGAAFACLMDTPEVDVKGFEFDGTVAISSEVAALIRARWPRYVTQSGGT